MARATTTKTRRKGADPEAPVASPEGIMETKPARTPARRKAAKPAATPSEDQLVDIASEDSMVASDPPSYGGVTGLGEPPPEGAAIEDVEATSPSAAPASAHASDSEEAGAPQQEVHLDVREEGDFETRVRYRAYELWEKEGSPPGKEWDHWLEAERSVKAEDEALRKSDGGD